MKDQTNLISPDAAPRQKSPARVAAGQRNGRLAAGKKSAAGKAASAQNAFQHGYRARAFSVLPTESREYFDSLAQSLFDELKPSSPRQSLLAEQIVRYHWLLQRNFRLEDAALTAEIVSQHNALPTGQAAPNTQLATWFAVDAAFNRNQALNTIYRHRAQLQRELARVTKQFDDLKSKESASALASCVPPLPVFSDEMFRAEIELPTETSAPTQNPPNEGNAKPGESPTPPPQSNIPLRE
jgi:hypothetical protein